jgi:molybdopterin/thiamine biosynthesis adenylyltransferase
MLIGLDDDNSRYHRQELITWWDQSRLSASRVLIVGAGALGNEVAKNLALVGVGELVLVDMDDIEHSNLARCVFFRESDEGSNKAQVLAREVVKLNNEVTASSFGVPIQRLGLGFISNFDLIIGALDNREARMWVNQAARKLGKSWIDGAIEGLHGRVRVFGPEGPCYECTLSENDYVQLSHRRSCALLAPEEILSGKTPTNATTAGIVSAVQSQEAIKHLVGREDLVSLVGKSWEFIGDSMLTFVTGFREDEFCPAHDVYENLTELSGPKNIRELIDSAGVEFSAIQAIDLEEDLLTLEACPQCGFGDKQSFLRSSAALGSGRCAECDAELPGEMSTSLLPSDARLTSSFVELGFARHDVVTVRTNTERLHFSIQGVQDV